MDDPIAFAAAQARCDSVAQLFGDQAPRSLQGESLGAYRARLLSKYQPYSPPWKGSNLYKIAADSAALSAAEAHIFKDACAAATRNDPGAPLRAVTSRDAHGRNITMFYGDPVEAWAPFMGAGVRHLTNIKRHPGAV